jgi:gliding motility-associated-like protein
MKIKYFLAFIISLVFISRGNSQTVQLFYEDFQTGGTTFLLNGTGIGTNTGTNEWIVDSNYFGGGIYPNTVNENNAIGGTISYAPYGYYLHIFDGTSGYLNDNYNPANASDRFAYMLNGICTSGLYTVNLNFFYLCQGSATAYGQVYYSRNGGPWIATGAPEYNNEYEWNYALVTDPAFNDAESLSIGFRWQNNAGSGSDTSAFGITDVSMTGYYDSINHPVKGRLFNLGPDTVCPGDTITLQYRLSDSLCDDIWNLYMTPGTYGWFDYIGPGYGDALTGTWPIVLPSTLPTGTCYSFKMVRSTFPEITVTDSICLYVEKCPTIINTMQPAVTLDTNAVCAGSVIDVPFASSGTFGTLNVYYAELSDSAGNFTTFYNLGSLISNLDYTSTAPGSVSGSIPLNVPAGCNYYVRVVADTPTTTGTVYGPFCIQHCDILTNGDTNIQACVWSCFKGPAGYTDTMYYNIHEYDSLAHYRTGNTFEVQVLSSQTFAAINTGGFGLKIDTTSSRMLIHVPCADSLTNILGISPCLYYVRIIATNSSYPDSSLGTVVHLTIGEPSDSLYMYLSPPGGTYCVNSIVSIYAFPYRYMVLPYNSTYSWWESTTGGLYHFPSPPNNYEPINLLLNSSSTFQIYCQESNYGCLGPMTELTDSITAIAPPVVNITGPSTICIGDTGTFSVPYTLKTSYQWTVSGYVHFDTANNLVKVKFDSIGKDTVFIYASDTCGPANKYVIVTVIAPPVPSISANPSTTVCVGASVKLVASGGITYLWSNNQRTSNITISPTHDTSYWVGVSNKGCTIKDTIKLTVIPTLTVIVNPAISQVCYGDTTTLTATGAQNYDWQPSGGLITSSGSVVRAVVTAVETYTVIGSTSGCTDTATVTVSPLNAAGSISSATSIVAGSSVTLSANGGGGSKYLWAPATGLNCDTCDNVVATPSITTIYTVTITDSAGCRLLDTVTVDVTSLCNIFVPDIFSPNNPNNLNTILYVRSGCLVTVDFIVFDRWGNKLFESKELNKGWDGNYLGQPMNSGTYVYYATGETSDGRTLTKKGSVTLLR